MSQRLNVAGLLRLLLFTAVAWVPAMVGLIVLWANPSAGPVAIALGLAGGAMAAALAAARNLKRDAPKLRPSAPQGAAASWDSLADPRGNYANRWASYRDLSGWLGARDWAGRIVAEFGRTNEVLRSFLRGATYEMLEYPEHDIQDLHRVASDRFDLAILDQTIEHVADPEKAMREVRRVLKNGGVAIVTTPFLVPLHPTQDYGDYTRWTPQGMRTMLERNGFQVEVRYWGNLAAARKLLDSMYLTAEEAKQTGLLIEPHQAEEKYPVTVWALATARK